MWASPMAKCAASSSRALGFRVHGVVGVLRHGDRSPGFNVFDSRFGGGGEDSKDGTPGEILPEMVHDHPASDEDMAEAERQTWAKVVAKHERIMEMCAKFPICRVNGNSAECVRKGVEVQEVVEVEPFKAEEIPFGRITEKGLEQLERRGKELAERYAKELDLSPGNLIAFSTNYYRTQHSMQSLLIGLFGEGIEDDRVRVFVPPATSDVGNSWESHEALRKAVGSIQETDAFFQKLEKANEGVRETFCSILPYYSHNPARFLWVYSCDYFVCRAAHNLPMDDRLSCLEQSTLNVTMQRFLRWYHEPSIMNLAAGDLIRAVKGLMEDMMDEGPNHKKMVLYSGHDITLLPVLCALKQFENRMEETTFEEDWPKYGSMLSFELLSREDDDKLAYFVRVLYNERELIGPTLLEPFWAEYFLPRACI